MVHFAVAVRMRRSELLALCGNIGCLAGAVAALRSRQAQSRDTHQLVERIGVILHLTIQMQIFLAALREAEMITTTDERVRYWLVPSCMTRVGGSAIVSSLSLNLVCSVPMLRWV